MPPAKCSWRWRPPHGAVWVTSTKPRCAGRCAITECGSARTMPGVRSPGCRRPSPRGQSSSTTPPCSRTHAKSPTTRWDSSRYTRGHSSTTTSPTPRARQRRSTSRASPHVRAAAEQLATSSVKVGTARRSAGVGFLDRLVYQERDAAVLPNPTWAIGGMRMSLTACEVRMDYVQHALGSARVEGRCEAGGADQYADVGRSFPSFQLALLAPILERAGFEVEPLSLFLGFGAHIGCGSTTRSPTSPVHGRRMDLVAGRVRRILRPTAISRASAPT